MIVSSPPSLNTRSGSSRVSKRASSRNSPGRSGAASSRVRPSQPRARPFPALQGDEGVPGEAQGQGGEEGRRGELQGKGLLQGVEPPEPPPSPGLQMIPGAGIKAAGVQVVAGHVQVAIIALHLRRQRPQPVPEPKEQAVSPGLQG